MNRTLFANILRFVLFLLIQVLVLKRVELAWENFAYIHLFIYPLFILLLPLKTPRALVVLLSFIMGMSVDIFYDSPGVHASALVLIGFFRPWMLKIIEPYEGYQVDAIPSVFHHGFTWFLIYSSGLLFAHLLFYFSVEAFSYVYYFDIILKTIFSFIFSIPLMIIHQLLFRTKH